MSALCRDSLRVDQFCELSASYHDGTKPGQKPLPPWGTLTLQPGPRFQQIGDGDGGESPITDKSARGTGTGESWGASPPPDKSGTDAPSPSPDKSGTDAPSPSPGKSGTDAPSPSPGNLKSGTGRALEQSWAPCARVLRLPFNGAMPKPEVPVSKGVRGDDPGDLIY